MLVGKNIKVACLPNYDFAYLYTKGLRIGGGARYFGSWYTYYLGTNQALANVGITSGHQYKLPHAIVYDMFANL